MEGIELEGVRQPERVAGHVRDLVGTVRERGPAHVPVVEDQGAVTLGEGGHLKCPRERVGRESHHAHEGLPLAVQLVVERLSAYLDRRHWGGQATAPLPGRQATRVFRNEPRRDEVAETTTEQAPPRDGQPAARIEVENPATGESIASVPALSVADVAGVVARARAAQPAWEALGFDGRGAILRRAQKWLLDNSDRVARTIVAETGKAYEDALLAEVAYAGGAFGFWAKKAPKLLADEKIRTSNPFVLGRKLVVRYAPVGVVGVIGPWNYPLTNSFGDCIPALAAGNSCVLKPASLTPLTSLFIAEGLRECGLPEDVFIVASGGGDVGGELIDHVDYVMFTGSTEVGRKVMERAARTLTPVGLELGGKDPMLVLADADLERAANAAVHYSMQNGGQTCISVESVYVEEPAYDEFVAKVESKLRELRQGVPGDPGAVDMGAVTSPPP